MFCQNSCFKIMTSLWICLQTRPLASLSGQKLHRHRTNASVETHYWNTYSRHHLWRNRCKSQALTQWDYIVLLFFGGQGGYCPLAYCLSCCLLIAYVGQCEVTAEWPPLSQAITDISANGYWYSWVNVSADTPIQWAWFMPHLRSTGVAAQPT